MLPNKGMGHGKTQERDQSETGAADQTLQCTHHVPPGRIFLTKCRIDVRKKDVKGRPCLHMGDFQLKTTQVDQEKLRPILGASKSSYMTTAPSN